ncbi:MAG: hypothetical protein K0Q53_291 [Massilibacillus sp.]|jgi:hypothetical protein|nr:hypothetical protein [Massilibacillus sp.]
MPEGMEFAVAAILVVFAGINWWYISRLNKPRKMYVSNYRKRKIDFKNTNIDS